MVLVGDNADAADDWIAECILAVDVCVTSDMPLASRCLKKGARVVSPTGHRWTEANIGNALAGREIARHLRELGATTRGPAPLTKKDRSLFSRHIRYGPTRCHPTAIWLRSLEMLPLQAPPVLAERKEARSAPLATEDQRGNIQLAAN